MAFTRTTTINSAPGGDSVKQAVLDLDTDLTGAFGHLNTHDHSGGDGAQIAYSSLSGLPSLGTISSQAANNVVITGGTINGTAIGGTTPAAGAFTTLSATGGVQLATSSGNLLVGTTTDDGVRVNVNTNVLGIQTDIAYGLQLQTSQGGAYFSRSGVLFKWNDTGNHVSWQTGSVVSGAESFDGNNKSGFLTFYTKPFTTSSVDLVERARITSTGNLLIGTTTDDGVNKLQVNGGISFVKTVTNPGAFSPTHKVPITINGITYYMALTTS